MKKKSELKNFESAMKKILSVSHEELQRREEKWKREKAAKRLAKSSAASRASSGRV
jgi:hypothetical protein